MANKSLFNRAVLISVLVLPALLYLFFVYGQSEVFFQTLDYVGTKQNNYNNYKYKKVNQYKIH
jgi:predicted DNA repair protein MutK